MANLSNSGFLIRETDTVTVLFSIVGALSTKEALKGTKEKQLHETHDITSLCFASPLSVANQREKKASYRIHLQSAKGCKA